MVKRITKVSAECKESLLYMFLLFIVFFNLAYFYRLCYVAHLYTNRTYNEDTQLCIFQHSRREAQRLFGSIYIYLQYFQHITSI